MPLNSHTSRSQSLVLENTPFFKCLAEFDAWADTMPTDVSGVVSYRARRLADDSNYTRGKLLLCHDFKGGYTESPFAHSYTFNFWSSCDAFIYFSHHRVTVPPSGWITAAHRQGVKMLGTLIFEGADEEDCLRLLVGRLPKSKSGPSRIPSHRTMPISPHYARLLASLARQRGFDGYLLNFECPLHGGVEQTRAVTAWISLLERELNREVGPHSEVIWYDSVIVDGRLRWQDRLNSVNLPFFIPSTGFFTNYTWPPHFPSLTVQYFLSIDAQHTTGSRLQRKSLQDIYVGVDIWGRGSHGGGGFGAYKAISHIDPEFLGLSVALFGQAWTWETQQDNDGFTWDTWWASERRLWLGPTGPNDIVQIPEPPPNQPVCSHDPYTPITSFFARKPPPDPLDLVLYTSFSPGVGRAWFVEGVRVMPVAKDGWTDLDKTTTIGDLAWPHPAVTSELGEWDGSPPVVNPHLCMEDAWMGGSSLRLDVTLPVNGSSTDSSFQCIWIPIQTLSLTSQQSYDIKLVYKLPFDSTADIELGLSVRPLDKNDDSPEIDIFNLPLEETALSNGWSRTTIRASVKSDRPSHSLAVGLILGIARDDPTASHDALSIRLGQLSAFPSPSDDSSSILVPQVLWADYQKHEQSGGVLTWEVAYSLPHITSLSIADGEDPRPAWTVNNSMRTFVYFNIYVEVGEGDSAQPLFIGTTGLDGRGHRFFVDTTFLPVRMTESKQLRFTIEGVTDHGEILSRDHCVSIDVEQASAT